MGAAKDGFVEMDGSCYVYEWDPRQSPSPDIVVEDIVVDPNPRNPRRQRVGGAVRRLSARSNVALSGPKKSNFEIKSLEMKQRILMLGAAGE